MVVLAVRVRAVLVHLPDAQPAAERVRRRCAGQPRLAVARGAQHFMHGRHDAPREDKVPIVGRLGRLRQRLLVFAVHGDQGENAEGVGPEVAAAVPTGAGRWGPGGRVCDGGEAAVEGFDGLLEALEARGGAA